MRALERIEKMDHVVFVDAKAKEMEKLLTGAKQMILRGAAGRKMPYGKVNPGDTLYLIRNNGEGSVQAFATVRSVVNSEKLTREDSNHLIENYQDKLQFTAQQMKRWAGKRYLVLIEVENVTAVEPFSIDRSQYGNMDDWLPVENIEKVKLS
jgi:hypothetical protein